MLITILREVRTLQDGVASHLVSVGRVVLMRIQSDTGLSRLSVSSMLAINCGRNARVDNEP